MSNGLKRLPLQQRRRLALIERLGNCCAMCGKLTDLEVDHKDGTQVLLRGLSQRQRNDLYEQEEKLGLLRVLCRSCNGHDGYLRGRTDAYAHVGKESHEEHAHSEDPGEFRLLGE